MMKRLFTGMGLIAIVIVVFTTVVFAAKTPDEVNKTSILNKTYRMQIPFIENKGQLENSEVSFYAKTFCGTVFVGKDGSLAYHLPSGGKGGVVLEESFTGRKVEIQGLHPSATRVNYIKGTDKSKWKTNIPSYESISLGKIDEGIELKLKAYGNNIEKIFTVSPEANPEKIEITLAGAKSLEVNGKGELLVNTKRGSVKFTHPVAYQLVSNEKEPVTVAYTLHNSTAYGFRVSTYDRKRPLIIDPLIASTFIGGSYQDIGHSIILDGSGNVYIAGSTSGSVLYPSDYPVTPGAYDETHNGWTFGAEDIMVSKFDSTLSTLLASTFIGGSGVHTDNISHAIALDGDGSVYVAGETSSSDYPATSGAYDETHNGSSDVFVSKLDSSLSSLLASTFIGSSSTETAHSLFLDGNGNVYVTGRAGSGYPTTPSAYDETHNGFLDVFISKLDGSLSSLLASTFIGGSSAETALSMFLDGNGNVYVTGRASPGYPTTPGAYDETHNGFSDVFISKLDGSLSSLLASTFTGGSDQDTANAIVLDGSGNVYVTGETSSIDYPATPGAYDEIHNGSFDVFVSKLDGSLSSLLASTFIGGSRTDIANAIVLDGSGNVYATGGTSWFDFPTTIGAYSEVHYGSTEVFISQLEGNLLAGDIDNDGIIDSADNCPNIPNGPDGGTCTAGTIGIDCMHHNECGTDGFCSMNQEDTNGDGSGNACHECDVDEIDCHASCEVRYNACVAYCESIHDPNAHDPCIFAECNPPYNFCLAQCCGDGIFCNGADTCINNQCVPQPSPCGDQSDCTDDICNEETDTCAYICNAPYYGHECCNDSSCNETGGICDPDDDNDGICDPGISDISCTGLDNCPNHPNPAQEDTYPPQGNAIGDACDCEADFNCDSNVDAADVTNFLTDFGRSTFFNPCRNADPCNGDFNCDGNVDAFDVTLFLEDFGRSQFNNPCPACEVGDWCVYP